MDEDGPSPLPSDMAAASHCFMNLRNVHKVTKTQLRQKNKWQPRVQPEAKQGRGRLPQSMHHPIDCGPNSKYLEVCISRFDAVGADFTKLPGQSQAPARDAVSAPCRTNTSLLGAAMI